jgi:rubrerythrin
MLHQVMLLAAAGERLIGSVYVALAAGLEPDTELGHVLERLAEEERSHAEILDELRGQIPSDYEGYDYEHVLSGQAEFLDHCTHLLAEAREEHPDVDDLLRRLVALEGSLSEKLLVHLKLLVRDEQRDRIASLATASSEHGRLLREFLPSPQPG